MHWKTKLYIWELLWKIIIASVAWTIIIFYNVDTIDKKISVDETYEQTLLQYHNAESIISSGQQQYDIIDKKITIDSSRNREEKDNIKNIVIETIQSIDSILKTKDKLYNKINSITINKSENKSRWYATHNILVINYGEMNEQEFIQVITHELWHIIDLWIIEWTSQIINKQYTEFSDPIFKEDDNSIWYYALSRDSENKRKLSSKKVDFCTTYWMTNPFEDFAECIQLYLNHHDYFTSIKESSTILKKKYDFIESLFWWNYINNEMTNVRKKTITYRYRDSTRML